MINVGVIGCGKIANAAHIPAYQKNPNVRVRYFCDILPERARAAVETYGGGEATADYHAVINDPQIDAVSICTPNRAHPLIAIDALRAGKHVLCEKPAARTYAEVEEMLRVQRETGKLLAVGVVNRFNDSVRKIKAYIDEGRLGTVHHVYVSFRKHRSIPGLGGAFTDRSIAGGGVLIDWGVHYLDIVMYCCGDPTPLTVSGETFSKLGRDIAGYTYRKMWAGPPKLDGVYDVEESVTGLVRTAGPVISFNGAWAQNIGENECYIDFMGDRAGIRLQYGKFFTLYTAEHGALVQYTPEFEMTPMFENEINAFVDAVEKGGAPLPSEISTVALTARIMQAVYDSAAAHREIALEDR